MISGVFYVVLPDSRAGNTVTAKVVDRVECFLNIWRYFRNNLEVQFICIHRSKICRQPENCA
jgi:hypothetical protein